MLPVPPKQGTLVYIALFGTVNSAVALLATSLGKCAVCSGPRPFIPVANTVKVQLVYTLNAQRCENVLNVISGGGLAASDLDRIETVFASWWTSTYRAWIHTACNLVLIVEDALNTAAGLHKEYNSGWTTPGLKGSASQPGNVTTAVKLSTGLRGRSYRGRIYVVGVTSDECSGNQLAAGMATNFANSWNTLRTNLAAGGDQLAVVSYCADGAWRAAGVATPVNGISCDNNLDSMRRRLSGRGL